MKNIFFLFFFIYLNITNANSQETPVFISGTEGYKSFRIPAIIKLKNGDLLAFCEGRTHGAGDYGDIDIVMKRSRDKGKTWSTLQVVAEFGNQQIGNPAPVEDLTDPDFPRGRIFLFFNTGNNHEGEILKGNGIKSCGYITSEDAGNTWSSPVDITAQVHLLNRPEVNSEFNSKEDWRYYANTPGHAIQLQTKPYRGRIYVAANHSAGAPRPHARHYVAHGYYTDDHGKTFHLSENVKYPGSNESTAAELTNGKLMMNSRNQSGDARARIVSISKDGGHHWDTTYIDHNLPDPICEGSLLKIGEKKGQAVLAFCNAASTKERNNLTLRISYDEGKSWSANIPVYVGKDNKADYAAYSDIISLDQKTVGVLYEKDNYSSITFVPVKWK